MGNDFSGDGDSKEDRFPKSDGDFRTPAVGRRDFLKATGAGAAATSLAGPAVGLSTAGQQGPLRFGAIYILSGFASVYGESAELGIEMAVDEINSQGGIDGREIGQVLFRDSEASASTAIQHARSLVQQDNVDGLIGLDSSGVALKVAPVVRQLRRPLMITHAATPFVTTQSGPNAQGNRYVYRDGVNLSQNLYGAANVARDLDAQSWTTIGPDYAFGHQTWDYFKAYTQGMDLGLNYMDGATAFPQLGASDFTPQINKVVNADPDAVVTSLWGGDLVTFLKQAQNTAFFDTVDNLLMTVGAATDVLQPLGSDMPDGLWAGTRYWFRAPQSDANDQFRQKFRNRYDQFPSYNAQNAYTGMYLYKKAIEQAGSAEPDAVVSQWQGMQHTGPVGQFTIDEQSHQAILPAVWGKTQYSQDLGISLLEPVRRIDAPADRLRSLLDGSDLPAGV
ncbi:ABC transporter substrate-binding protein [Halomicrococcus sp. NG-SE-24]|uniref:ABC transporter substrate-binding protein n=1 Tax=Halomicrococcus sp. NG-SE-24 TaxID=3436928 RepID=UPI003D96010C